MDIRAVRTIADLLATRRSRRAALSAGIAGAAGALGLGGADRRLAAREATPMSEDIVVLFVQADFAGGTLEPAAGDEGLYTLTHSGAPAQTIYFSDRPDRLVGVVSTRRFLDLLDFSADDPPNAALIAQIGDGADETAAIVLELLNPTYDAAAATLAYEIRLLDGFERLDQIGAGFAVAPISAAELPRTFGPCSLFIDSAGCSPLDPRC